MNHEVHISTVTGQDVISLSNNVIAVEKVYKGSMSQSGTNAPVVTVLENTFGNIVWSYGGSAGVFQGDLIGAFDIARMSYQDGCQIGTGFNKVALLTISPLSENAINVFSNVLTLQGVGVFVTPVFVNGILSNHQFGFELLRDISTVEMTFNAILDTLDVIQLLIWNKIVIRFNNTVTEVDGKKWRKTANFVTSSKVINS
jgi:hypothetical protein